MRTILNILGPLTNPAGAPNQVMGVFHPDLVGIQARVLKMLGSRHVITVHGHDGLDEITITGPTHVAELQARLHHRVHDRAQAVRVRRGAHRVDPGEERSRGARARGGGARRRAGPGARHRDPQCGRGAVRLGRRGEPLGRRGARRATRIASGAARGKLDQLVQFTPRVREGRLTCPTCWGASSPPSAREIERAEASAPEREVEQLAARAAPPRGFERALRRAIANGRPAVIAEIKRASPSRGLIRADFDPARIASAYDAHGASCLSVLTDREYLRRIARGPHRGACRLHPAGPAQGLHGRSLPGARGARLGRRLHPADRGRGAGRGPAPSSSRCREGAGNGCPRGMPRSPDSWSGRWRLPTALIGINNRDLRTFETRLETTLSMVSRVPADRILVTESGISPAGGCSQAPGSRSERILSG